MDGNHIDNDEIGGETYLPQPLQDTIAICNMHYILDVSDERERNSGRGNKFYSTHEGYYLKGTAVEISTLSARCRRAVPFSKSNPYPLPGHPCHHLLLLDIRSSAICTINVTTYYVVLRAPRDSFQSCFVRDQHTRTALTYYFI